MEPFGSFYESPSELGWPASWVAMAARADAREQAAERREAEARAAAAGNRHERLLHEFMLRAWMEGRPFDPADPSTFVPSVEETTERVFRFEDAEMARSERREAIRDGRLHVLNVTPAEMTPAAPPQVFGPEGEEAARTRRRSVLGLGNSIRWARKRAKEAIR